MSDCKLNLFPTRAFIQIFDEIPPDYQAVVDELKSRGNCEVILKTTEEILANPLQLTKNDLVVGNFDWTRHACRQLGLPMPLPCDYPECLEYLLLRKVWNTTLGEFQAYMKKPENKDTNIFVKPSENHKSFQGLVEPRDQMVDCLLAGIPGIMEPLPATEPVCCSEIVKMIAEYRVYCVNGEIRHISQYRGPKEDGKYLDEAKYKIDMDTVNEACEKLFASEHGPRLAGCGIDFAVLELGPDDYATCLVEVNDGFSLGRYDGLSAKDYTDLLVARWATLVKDL